VSQTGYVDKAARPYAIIVDLNNAGFFHPTVAASAVRDVKVKGHNERTNRIAIHFSPKIALACCNSCAVRLAANIKRSRSD
jgi:hypothetical protein